MIASKTQVEKTPDYSGGNSQLLKDYRATLLKAYHLGNDIKEVYGIVPPKVLSEETWSPTGNNITIGLVIS